MAALTMPSIYGGFSGEDGGTVKLNAVSRVDALFSYG
jgi:hypothetical protein